MCKDYGLVNTLEEIQNPEIGGVATLSSTGKIYKYAYVKGKPQWVSWNNYAKRITGKYNGRCLIKDFMPDIDQADYDRAMFSAILLDVERECIEREMGIEYWEYNG